MARDAGGLPRTRPASVHRHLALELPGPALDDVLRAGRAPPADRLITMKVPSGATSNARALSAFRKRRLVELDGRTLRLLQPETLAGIAHGA